MRRFRCSRAQLAPTSAARTDGLCGGGCVVLITRHGRWQVEGWRTACVFGCVLQGTLPSDYSSNL